ncbi:MAG TPA: tetratricopeptide repeat protein [Candidatus Omnitrophica bacterium]|nr:tetratricopeptide repeat protein [Candidatus Omnitrophota bacterium]
MRFLVVFLIGISFCVFAFSQTGAFHYSHYLKGVFYLQKGNFSSALKELEKARQNAPQSIYIRLKIAACLIRLEKLEKAEKELKEIKKISPDNIDASLALIFLYSYAKKDKELEEEYEEFLKKIHRLRPQDLRISEYLAQYYFYKEKPQEAIKLYEAIIEKKPDYAEGLFWLGYLYEEVGEREKAVQMWKKALKAEPNHAPALNSLGYIYAEEGINLDEAEEMIKKALEVEPQNGAYLDSLGWVYFKKGNYQKAEEFLKKAIGFLKDPVIYEHLGDLYIKMDNIEEAIRYYKEGVDNFPDNKNLKEKLKKYERKDKILKN